MTVSPALTCKQFVALVTDYLEGALAAPEQLRFEQHLAACEDCPVYLEQIRQTIRIAGALREESLSAGARATLLHAFRHWNARRPSG
ncbi:MAG: zf-HC2 domain-containing protein [Actinobacteria bacterium]|nr:zf-HC2 domain-containing protein [Actinomycetota bacterium]